MAMNERTTGAGGAADEPVDPRLAALYREAAQETPPPQLDAAILAAARREAGTGPRPAGGVFPRAWRLPMAVAAVLVLSVSVVALMWEEGGDRLLREPAPGTAEPMRERAPPAAQQPRPEAAAPAPQRAESIEAGPAARAPQPGLARRGPEAEHARPQAPAAAMTAPPAERAEAAPDRASAEAADARLAAKPAPRQFNLERQYEHEPPQKWLERIAELRREGRQAEADELLEAFRKRFPDHPLPEALR
jgi:hypothetical protein